MVKSTIAVEDQIRGRGKGEGLPNGDVVDSNPVLGIPFFYKNCIDLVRFILDMVSIMQPSKKVM